jgi:hypothetical protein
MEEVLRSNGVKTCRKRALDRREWAAIVKTAKAKLYAPQSYWNNNNLMTLVTRPTDW